jgi:hypothetical protein
MKTGSCAVLWRDDKVLLVTERSGSLGNRQLEEHVAPEWFTVAEAVTLNLAHPEYPALFREIAERG